MSEIHELVLTHGVEKARELVSAQDRRLVEIAAEMLADETARMGISHAGFALTSLPHRATLLSGFGVVGLNRLSATLAAPVG